jgi:hypothetical protein
MDVFLSRLSLTTHNFRSTLTDDEGREFTAAMSTTMPSIAVSLGIVAVAIAPCASDASPVTTSQQLVAPPESDITGPKLDAGTVVVNPASNWPLLQIKNLRLDSSPPDVAQPAALLKFELLNDTSLRLTDILVRVSFVDDHGLDAAEVPARVIVGPVTVLVKAVLQAESVVGYEMLFRNLSSDCDCSPSVVILSARSLPE